MVVWSACRPRSVSNSSTSRSESEYRRYQRTAQRISSGAVCRHLKIAGRVAFFTVFSDYQPCLSNLQHIRFIDWGEVFGDQVLATAILDRLLHHSSTINIKGESFRLKEKRRAGLLSQQAPENTAAPARDSAKSSSGGTA